MQLDSEVSSNIMQLADTSLHPYVDFSLIIHPDQTQTDSMVLEKNWPFTSY